MSQELSLNMSLNKEYAVIKPKVAGRPAEENAVAAKEGEANGRLEWKKDSKDNLFLDLQLADSSYLLNTSTTETSARVARSGQFSREMLTELKQKFKKMFVAAYGNIFSHNRLLSKVSEWMVGNVMERLALMGMSLAELDELKSSVRADLIGQNFTAMEQVAYDRTMLEIVG